MKTVLQRILSAVLVLCVMAVCLLPAVTPAVSAVEPSSAPKRFNIMLVIDGSGSLETASRTDPDRMRYELVSDLLGNLENDGHNIGAVVFSGTNSRDTSKMEDGIMLNTGLFSLDNLAPNGLPTKEYIYNQIVDAGYDRTRNGTTDVGTALLVAERTLLEKQKENGLESLIFLFTDGVTDLPTEELRSQSSANLDTATGQISGTDNVRLMGIFLNKDGKLPSNEIKGIVCAANGITENSEEFTNSYVEIHDAASAHNAVAVMLRFMGYISNRDPAIIYDSLDDTFTIPGIGVEEMNIRLYSPNGQTLPDMNVILTKPDGTEIKGTELTAMGRFGRTFHVYKLVDPMPGTWKLHIQVPAGNSVGYCYDPVINLYIEAGMTVSPDVASWHVNQDVTFAGHLSQGGTVVTEPASYREYACTLVITNLLDGTIETIDIPNNNTGKFETAMKLDKYGQFEAQILFTCDEIVVASNTVEYLLENQTPTTDGTAKVRVTYGLMQQGVHDVDLTQYFSDVEDGKNLTVRMQSTDCPSGSYTLTGTNLQLNAPELKDNTMELVVEDSQGATAALQLTIVSRSVTAGLVTLALVILAIIIGIVIVIIIVLNSIKPKGSLKLTVGISDDDSGDQSYTMFLGVPNANAPSRTNLGKLMAKALEDNAQTLQDAEVERLQSLYNKSNRDLSNIRVASMVQFVKGKLIGAIRVSGNGASKVLYNSTWTTKMAGVSYTLSFMTSQKSTNSDVDDIFSEEDNSEDTFIEESTDVESLF